MTKKSICDTLRRTCLILAGSFIMAVNLKSFVRAGGLIPGGFNGLTRLIQEISVLLWHWEPPFGGLINALAISLCLFANATSGGTDFIAIFLSEKYSIDSWNYIFAGNVVILGIAGALFGWDKALYSIIFQYTSTQVLHVLYKRYQKQTLIIVTKRPEDVYEAIAEITHHDATLIKGEGCYSKQECDVLYSVVGRDEVSKVVNTVRETDPQAFVNMIRTENLAGRFYQRPND